MPISVLEKILAVPVIVTKTLPKTLFKIATGCFCTVGR